jgi:DinB superfamily
MAADRSYLHDNDRERERLRALIEGLSEDDLRAAVNEFWTVAGVLGHIAFWDARALSLADKLDRSIPFSPSDAEPEDVDWINDASRALIHAIEPVRVARLALQIAEATDARVAGLPVDRLWPNDPASPLYPVRASHRGEHLDEIDAALRAPSHPSRSTSSDPSAW